MRTLAIDFGAAATKVAWWFGDEARLLPVDGQPEFPTAVHVRPNRELVVRDALSYLGSGRVVTEIKHRVGAVDPLPPADRTVPVGASGDRVALVDLVAAVLAHAATAAPEPVDQVVLAHPVSWGAAELRLLTTASRHAGLPATPVLVPEPAAAAASVRSRTALPAGVVAVFDLGASTLDIAVVDPAALASGGPAVAERGAATGGDDLDAALLDFVEEELTYADPAELAGFRRFRDTWPARAALAARAEKEALSSAERVVFPAALADGGQVDVPVTREAWVDHAEPVFTGWLAALDECLDSLAAGTRPAVLLGTGGSIAVPAVRDELAAAARRRNCRLVLAGDDGLGPGRHVAPGALIVAEARAERARREAAAASERAAKARRESFDRELARVSARDQITDVAVAAVRELVPTDAAVRTAVSWRHASDVITFGRYLNGRLGLLVLTETTMTWSCLAAVVTGTLHRRDIARIVVTRGADSLTEYGRVKVVRRTGSPIRFWSLTDAEIDAVRRWYDG